MHAPADDRFVTELRGCTAELARIIDGDLERPVPTCPGWTFRQLATHLGRGHRWAAQIVATRATTPIPMREVADGKLPHATDAALSGTGEWLVTRTPSGVTVARGHGKADVAVRGPAASLLLVLTRRLPPSDPGIEILGEQALLIHWLQHTPF
jgi:hypothetical protein